MKILSLYEWFIGSQNSFVNQYRGNEALYNQARAYWSKLDGNSMWLLIFFLLLGLGMVWGYYQPYNTRPGRHYTLKHWTRFLGVTFVLAFTITWLFLYYFVSSNLDVTMLRLMLALGNAIYTSVLYFLLSVIWCKFLPTNAYRFV